MSALRFIIIILIITNLIATACSNSDEAQKLDATITILAPTAGQVFEKGDTIHIEADIKAAQELHGWEIVIRKKADNSVVYSEDRHTHGEELHIHEHWVNNVTAHTDLTLEVTAALDHSGKNLKTETVNFHCHPN